MSGRELASSSIPKNRYKSLDYTCRGFHPDMTLGFTCFLHDWYVCHRCTYCNKFVYSRDSMKTNETLPRAALYPRCIISVARAYLVKELFVVRKDGRYDIVT